MNTENTGVTGKETVFSETLREVFSEISSMGVTGYATQISNGTTTIREGISVGIYGCERVYEVRDILPKGSIAEGIAHTGELRLYSVEGYTPRELATALEPLIRAIFRYLPYDLAESIEENGIECYGKTLESALFYEAHGLLEWYAC